MAAILVIALAIATGVSSRVGPGIATLRVVLLVGTTAYAISAVVRGPFHIIPMVLLLAGLVFLALPLTRRRSNQLSVPGVGTTGSPGLAGPSVATAAMHPLPQEDGTAQCPLCRETIHPEALLCRHCGSNLGGGASAGASGGATGVTAAAQPPETSGLAVASLVCSILACGIGSLLGVIFGHMALSRIKQSGQTIGGRGLALAGTIIGWIGLAIAIAYLVFMLVIRNSSSTTYYY